MRGVDRMDACKIPSPGGAGGVWDGPSGTVDFEFSVEDKLDGVEGSVAHSQMVPAPTRPTGGMAPASFSCTAHIMYSNPDGRLFIA